MRGFEGEIAQPALCPGAARLDLLATEVVLEDAISFGRPSSRPMLFLQRMEPVAGLAGLVGGVAESAKLSAKAQPVEAAFAVGERLGVADPFMLTKANTAHSIQRVWGDLPMPM